MEGQLKLFIPIVFCAIGLYVIAKYLDPYYFSLAVWGLIILFISWAIIYFFMFMEVGPFWQLIIFIILIILFVTITYVFTHYKSDALTRILNWS